MALAQGADIQKVTANSIVGVINDFNSIVVNQAHSKVQYHSGNVPHFTGSATGSTGTWTNPAALPTNQLAANSQSTMTAIEDDIITASSLWSSMLTITRYLVKIRKFTSTWIHAQPAQAQTINTVTGWAVFNTAFPAVPTGNVTVDSQTENWTRGGNTSITLSPAQTINSGADAAAANMNTAINNCYNAWVNSCYNANELTYTYYTCHSNCHSNWGDARGRR